jgi:hypothetical protein
MDRFPDTPRRLFPLIFISSLTSLAYELALIRIFSFTLWYHFAFMVISIAMLGIGASGTLLSVVPALKDLRRIPAYGLALAIGIPVSYLLANLVPFDPARLSWDRLQLLYIGIYYLVLGVPFLAFGLIVSTAFSAIKEYPGLVYASDLLGAGAGSLLVFWLLFLGGPEQAVFIISSLATAGLLLYFRGWMRLVAGLVIALNVLMLMLHPSISHPRISPTNPSRSRFASPERSCSGPTTAPTAASMCSKAPRYGMRRASASGTLNPCPNRRALPLTAATSRRSLRKRIRQSSPS